MIDTNAPSPVGRLIGLFGGLTRMARALGHRHCTTVQGWERSGRIPAWRRPEIEDAATRQGVALAGALLDGCLGPAPAADDAADEAA